MLKSDILQVDNTISHEPLIFTELLDLNRF